MSVSRNELHELVERLPDDQVASAADELRARLFPARSPRVTKPFAWIGMGVTKEGETDVSANVDNYLALGFGQDTR